MQYAISAIKAVLPASMGGSSATAAVAGEQQFDLRSLRSSSASSSRQVTAKLVATLAGHDDRVWMVAWHPSGSLLASCSGDKTVRIWSKKKKSLVAAGEAQHEEEGGDEDVWTCISVLSGEHRRTVRCVSWSPDGNRLACSSFDATVTIWKRTNNISSSSSSQQQANYVFDLQLEAQLDGHENEVKCVAWASANSSSLSAPAHLATCSRDKTVWIWEQSGGGGDDDDEEVTFECAGVLEGHTQDVKFVRWLPASCSCSSTSSGKKVSNIVLSGGYDDSLKIWEENPLRRDDWHCTATLVHHSSTVWEAAVQPTAVTGKSRNNNNHNLSDEDETEEEAPRGKVANAEEEMPPPLIASCSDDRSVVVWAKRLSSNSNSSSTSVSSSRGYDVAGTCREVSGRALYSIDWNSNGGLLAVGSGADGVTFLAVRERNEDDDPILSGSNGDGEAAGQTLPLTVHVVGSISPAHDADVNCVRFAPHDPMTLATTSDDGTIRVWRLQPL